MSKNFNTSYTLEIFDWNTWLNSKVCGSDNLKTVIDNLIQNTDFTQTYYDIFISRAYNQNQTSSAIYSDTLYIYLIPKGHNRDWFGFYGVTSGSSNSFGYEYSFTSSTSAASSGKYFWLDITACSAVSTNLTSLNSWNAMITALTTGVVSGATDDSMAGFVDSTQLWTMPYPAGEMQYFNNITFTDEDSFTIPNTNYFYYASEQLSYSYASTSGTRRYKNIIIDNNTYTYEDTLPSYYDLYYVPPTPPEPPTPTPTPTSNLTIADYLNQLVADKNTLVTNLQAKGVSVTGDETFTELAPAVAEIPTSKQVAVEFYDYDGTVFASYSREEALALTALPAGPVHPEEELVFDGWNWTLEEIKNYVTRYPEGEVVVGSLFDTDTSATKIYVTLDETTLTPEVGLVPNTGSVTMSVDWGDGSTPDSYTTSQTVVVSHTYASPGSYVISLSSNGYMKFSGSANTTPSFYGAAGMSTSSSSKAKSINARYWQCVTKLHFGKYASFNQYYIQFQYLPVKFITMSAFTTVQNTTSTTNAFYAGAYSLRYAAFSRAFTKIGGSTFNGCSDVIVALPGNLIEFSVTPNTQGTTTYPIRKFTLPDTCTTFSGSNTAWGTSKLVIPRNVTSSNTQIPLDVEELYVYNVFTNAQNGETWVMRFDTGRRNKIRVLKYYGDPTKLNSVSGNFAGINFDSLDTNIDLTRLKVIGSTYTFTYATKKEFYFPNLTDVYSLNYMFSYAVTERIIFDKQITTPSGITSFCANTYVLRTLKLPAGITDMTSMSSYNLIDTIEIPSTVTTLGSSPFTNCYALRVIDCSKLTAVPGNNTNYSSSSFPSLQYVVVPDDLYSSWTSVGNWASYSSLLIKASEYFPS